MSPRGRYAYVQLCTIVILLPNILRDSSFGSRLSALIQTPTSAFTVPSVTASASQSLLFYLVLRTRGAVVTDFLRVTLLV